MHITASNEGLVLLNYLQTTIQLALRCLELAGIIVDKSRPRRTSPMSSEWSRMMLEYTLSVA